MDSGLPWRRIGGLHVVKHVEAVARAYGLALGHVDVGSGEVRAAHVIAAGDAGCRWAEDGACTDALLRAVRDLDADARPTPVACHRGVRELVAPIVVDGTVRGALGLGGFHEDVAPDGITALSRVQIELLATLLHEAARDVASVLIERNRAPEGPRASYGAIIGASAPMQELYGLLDRVARSDSTVLIQGENGTGKELVARAIHDHSDRHDRRFVVTNCSAFNDNLLDSELFGHKRGAFTGAVADKPGLFEVADAGTFFLDEIGDMSPALQVKVLRVLQEGTFNRVGDTDTRKVDVRIIAATNRDLRGMVERGQFREDLYYRVNVINLVLPALRQRRDDIPLLVEAFLDKQRRNAGRNKRLGDDCLARMVSYGWPGNVRELENEIERLVVLSGDELVIGEDLLSARIRQQTAGVVEESRDPEPSSLPEAVQSLERRMILDALKRNRWNKTRASAELQVSRRNLIRLVQKYGLEPAPRAD
ncbi:MAG: sigma 54-interacting transcriptional regulator [Kofleriaceae bacterium]|nr:sigma 54-interacting transcriptional regulator [Myxococcales bacterium]MCB9559441.1 sigma 54-interacting transcriptional regulator [Kofleriaceae bacterium]MCB9574262.1 sigma 54-interacting transcriptional regulator [Kofleriaceae bacterium]